MIGYPFTYYDELTIEESCEPSREFGRGFTTAVAVFSSYKTLQFLSNVKPALAQEGGPPPAQPG